MSRNPQQLYAIAEPYYPESDGKPMTDNTIQFDGIEQLKND